MYGGKVPAEKGNKIYPEGFALTNNNSKAEAEARQRRIRGDLTTYTEARDERNRKLRERVMTREKLAQEMSERVMDERERLSLSTVRSRATSRAASPRPGRPHDHTVRSNSPDRTVSVPSTANPSPTDDVTGSPSQSLQGGAACVTKRNLSGDEECHRLDDSRGPASESLAGTNGKQTRTALAMTGKGKQDKKGKVKNKDRHRVDIQG